MFSGGVSSMDVPYVCKKLMQVLGRILPSLGLAESSFSLAPPLRWRLWFSWQIVITASPTPPPTGWDLHYYLPYDVQWGWGVGVGGKEYFPPKIRWKQVYAVSTAITDNFSMFSHSVIQWGRTHIVFSQQMCPFVSDFFWFLQRTLNSEENSRSKLFDVRK